MNNLYMRFPEGRARCLTLSYDDGVQQDMQLCGLMKKYGIAGTFNISTGNYSKPGKVFEPGRFHRPMTLEECLKTYKDQPLFEVATHALHHAFLPDIPLSEAVNEICQDRRNIEQQYSVFCRGHAYPYGRYDDRIISVLKSCGIVYARTIMSTHSFDIPQNWLVLNPTCHHKDQRLMELADKFLNGNIRYAPYLFYLWGHSYEFETDNNWDVIENFFKKVSARDDVWYATNIEVYDYVQAFNSLVYSADGLTVLNPSARDVWVSLNSKNIHKIPAGGKVSL